LSYSSTSGEQSGKNLLKFLFNSCCPPHTVNRHDRHLLAHAMSSYFSYSWQF
jgi:hypothetical protein